jgi:nucleoside-triphosphatase
MPHRIFVTGLPGSGKSSLVMEIAKTLGIRTGGLSTPETREKGFRTGFGLVDLASRKEGTLASIHRETGPQISKYKVNLHDLENIGVKAIENSLLDPEVKLIIIDELGAMEMVSKKFEQIIERVFDSDKDLLIVLHRKFVNRYKNKGRVFVLTWENRKEIRKEILDILK